MAISNKDQEYLDLLEGSVQEVFEMRQKNKLDMVPKFYGVQTIPEYSYTELGIGALGEMGEFNGEIKYEDFRKGYEKQFTQVKYSNGISYPLEFATLYGRSKKQEIVNGANKLSQSAYNTQQTHAAECFNNAFTTYTTPDGQALISASHLAAPGADTQSNIFSATDLTNSNVSTIRNAMYQYKDDKGNLLGLNPRVIIVGDWYLDKAKKLCGMDKEFGTANNDMNANQEMTYIHCPRIQGKKWFLVDPDEMMLFNKWIWAKKPAISQTIDFDTEKLKYKVVGLWTKGATSWHWVAGATQD